MRGLRFLFVAFFCGAVLCAKSQTFDLAPGDKAALLMVHFGTTFDDTRAMTIDAVNSRVAEAFPELKVAEAYTSRMVIRRLKARGVEKATPKEMLLRLAAEGYTHVVIQSTTVIAGIETEALSREAELMAPFFKEIRVGRPLMYSVDDCLRVADILSARYASRTGKGADVVLVGHGTATPATATYSQLDYMFSAMGRGQFHVATVEGYPTYDAVLGRLRASRAKGVTLVPLMFVAGDHARNDINGEWRERLEAEGFKVSAIIEGLGQIPEIQEIYVEHIRAALAKRPLGAAESKAEFLRAND